MPIIDPPVVNAFTFSDANEMHESVCRKLVFGTTIRDRDWTHGTEVGLHNVALGCRSFQWQFDLKRYWISRSRWDTMVKQYVDRQSLEDCLQRVSDRLTRRGRGIAVLRTNTVQGRGMGRNVRRRWGSCMLNLSYRSNPIPTVTLHSRTTYFGYLAVLDVSVARTFAKMCGELTGNSLEDTQFVWTMDLAQFHGFRSLSWALGNSELKKKMDSDVDSRKEKSHRTDAANESGYRKALDGYSRILSADRSGKLYGDEKFSSFNRVRRRFHAEIMGIKYSNKFAGGAKDVSAFAPLPPFDSDLLNFDCLKLSDVVSNEIEDDDEDEGND